MTSPKDLYLILYNGACCLGWAYVLSLAIPTAVSTGLSTVYAAGSDDGEGGPGPLGNLADALFYVQTAALLEIVHAALGLVRSPVFVTTLQVGSRIAALYAITHSPESQVQFGAGMMIISWALVEVPRYAFYLAAIITGDATKKTPYPLFWLRYSLFAVLYPTGITGELTVFLSAAKDEVFLNTYGPEYASAMYYFIMSFPVIYAPGALPMILNMAGNRKSAFKKRFAKPPPPPRGIVFPVSGNKGGIEVRSSTPVGKAILSAAVGAVDSEKAAKVEKERSWRFKYVKHIISMVEAQCASPEAALKVAQAGIDKAYEVFQFVKPDGTTMSVKEVMASKAETQFSTGFIKGQGASEKNVLSVPYKGGSISGQALKDQVKKWVDYGTIEPSAGDAICACVDNPGWMDLSDRYFVLLGAGSAMGPFKVLMALGANVVAIDLDRPGIWERLIDVARKSSGSITFPLSKPQEDCKTDADLYAVAGCNLFTQTPAIRDWLLDLYPGKPFTVGSYAYLDGALHVQVSLAMDCITRDLSEKRPNTSLVYLCTPTDLHLVPEEANRAAEKNYKEFSKKPYCILMNLLSQGKFLRKNARKPVQGEGGDYFMINGVSVAQGPNYILAKRMQHWRAVIARSKGCIVSSNIAPSTSTVSVVHNRTFAWAYEGMPYFRPYEIFEPDVSKAVMLGILMSDLNDPKSAANPSTKLGNPNQLFSYGSFHGGTWRCAYEVDSIGEASVLLYFARVGAPYFAAVVGIGVAVGAKVMGFV
uniref:very-long-chain (3R)-3-hydroxyacyl-CoA dehydratase n=1 Tax=Trieres chinensis TaxID=1514140 RepID=A0A7S1YXL8_TRICV|eukprot:CAMPEP_0183297570 /NCGR_PEP_ID=MMETSP0160_2-20130417/4822_1 /TAXON_ID=2839 ORGANISM="Odontella Sinensis, Strain Grunow 1884" /NCGR_SAMPLE_ID=MMETSP0160_2 /ASSEMBLY_ACC=CAM_ASM_000250 /LENGTH=759 /DNA_ID=CAMNT_0025459419 /DNA_START=56 /DNA_END=2335 /DNA_ORIENTATION=+